MSKNTSEPNESVSHDWKSAIQPNNTSIILDISEKINQGEIHSFLVGVGHSQVLRTLRVSNDALGIGASQTLSQILHSNTLLDTLVLSNNRLLSMNNYFDLVKAIVEHVKQHAIKEALMSNLEHGIVLLASPCSIQTLDISYSNLEDQGVSWIAPLLRYTHISSLTLRHNGITTEGFKTLVHELKQTKSASTITNQEISVPIKTKIVHLDLSGNLPGFEGINALYDYIYNNNTLEHLALAKCGLGDRSVSVIAKALDKGSSSRISYLDISGNDEISDVGGKHLLGALVHNRLLTHILLSDSQVTEEVLNDISAATNANLELIDARNHGPWRLCASNSFMERDTSNTRISSATLASNCLIYIGTSTGKLITWDPLQQTEEKEKRSTKRSSTHRHSATSSTSGPTTSTTSSSNEKATNSNISTPSNKDQSRPRSTSPVDTLTQSRPAMPTMAKQIDIESIEKLDKKQETIEPEMEEEQKTENSSEPNSRPTPLRKRKSESKTKRNHSKKHSQASFVPQSLIISPEMADFEKALISMLEHTSNPLNGSILSIINTFEPNTRDSKKRINAVVDLYSFQSPQSLSTSSDVTTETDQYHNIISKEFENTLWIITDDKHITTAKYEKKTSHLTSLENPEYVTIDKRLPLKDYSAISISRYSDKVVLGGTTGQISLWNLNTSLCVHMLVLDNRWPISSIKIHKNYVYVGVWVEKPTRGGHVLIFTVESDSLPSRMNFQAHEDFISGIHTFDDPNDPNHVIICTAGWDGKIKLWRWNTQFYTYSPITSFSDHNSKITQISGQGPILASCSVDSQIIIWDFSKVDLSPKTDQIKSPRSLAQQCIVKKFIGDSGGPTIFLHLTENLILLSGSPDTGTLRVWK